MQRRLRAYHSPFLTTSTPACTTGRAKAKLEEEDNAKGEEEQRTMGSGGANTAPLLTPYKMGKFDVSHRYAPAPLLSGWANFPIS